MAPGHAGSEKNLLGWPEALRERDGGLSVGEAESFRTDAQPCRQGQRPFKVKDQNLCPKNAVISDLPPDRRGGHSAQ